MAAGAAATRHQAAGTALQARPEGASDAGPGSQRPSPHGPCPIDSDTARVRVVLGTGLVIYFP